MITLEDVALLRVVAHRLAGPRAATPTEAVRWSTCVQAQEFRGALTSVALRTRRPSRDAVVAALDSGEVVRSWPMRGTLHLVAAKDLPWLQRLLAPRVVRSSAGRLAGLGLDEPQLVQARELAVAALHGGRGLSRSGLFAAWEQAGLSTTGQRGVHLLRYLAMTGIVVLGPTAGGEQLVVLLDEWIPRPRDLDGDEALGELALRYFRSHGPAPASDLTSWAKLTARETRAAVALARPSLSAVDVEGTEHLLDPQTPDLLGAARADAAGVLLLPGFDELLVTGTVGPSSTPPWPAESCPAATACSAPPSCSRVGLSGPGAALAARSLWPRRSRCSPQRSRGPCRTCSLPCPDRPLAGLTPCGDSTAVHPSLTHRPSRRP